MWVDLALDESCEISNDQLVVPLIQRFDEVSIQKSFVTV